MSEHGRGSGTGGARRLRVVHDTATGAPLDDELWIRAEASQLRAARDFAAHAADSCGFDEEGRYQFMLAASEAVSNAIVHGAPFADGNVRLRMVEEDGKLSLYVSDQGASSTWDLADPGSLSERGRGLGLVSLLMDEVELMPTAERTTVRLSKRLL